MLGARAGTIVVATLAFSLTVAALQETRGQQSPGCKAPRGRVAHAIAGEARAGERFERPAGPFILRLTPVTFANVAIPVGWRIGVFEFGRDEDLSRFTLPLRGPNARDLFAWHFRNSDNTGPNDGSVNAPGEHRAFQFSPEVGRTIVWEEDSAKRWANYARIEAFGRGTFDLLDFRLTDPQQDGKPSFLWIRFEACLTWPTSPAK